MKKRILEYLLLAFGIPALCIFFGSRTANDTFRLILYGIEGASPAIAVILILLLHNKAEHAGKYLRDKYLSHLSVSKCLLGCAIPFAILTGAKIASIIMGDPYFYPEGLTIRKVVIILWALIAEELGWRGYLQDKLQNLVPDRYIPLLTGMTWALWHYHFLLSGSMEVPIVAFTLGCILESYGYFMITKLARNNIVPASIWHFTGNLMFNIYRFDPQWHNGDIRYYWIATGFYALCPLLYYIYKKRQCMIHGKKHRHSSRKTL